VIEIFPGAFDQQGDGLLHHGRLYVFHRHLAFRSQLPFGLSTSAVIPLKARAPCVSAFAAGDALYSQQVLSRCPHRVVPRAQ